MTGTRSFSRLPRTWALAVLIAVLMLTLPVTQGFTDFHAAVGDLPDAVPEPPCVGEKAAAAARVPHDALALGDALYAAHPGFVATLYVDDPEPRVLVVIDSEAPGALPLPAALPFAGAVPVEVLGETFTPLVGSADDPVPDADDLLPEACLAAIRPGARIDSGNSRCTANFIFEAANGTLYVGSAGHCYPRTGVSVSIPTLGTIGEVVFMIDEGIGRDFALIEIRENMRQHVDPSICHWGGPDHGDGASVTGETVQHYGFGLAWGTHAVTRPREGVGYGHRTTDFTFLGLVAGGDSGSALRHADGGAIGVITHGTGAAGVGFGGYGWGTSLGHAKALAAADGYEVSLVTPHEWNG